MTNLFHSILDHIEYAILITDKDAKYVFVNKFVRDNTNTSLSDWTGKRIEDILAIGIYDKSYILDVMNTKQEVSGIIYTEKGYSSLSTCTPIFDHHGNIKYVVTVSVNPDRFNNLLEKATLASDINLVYKQEVEYLRNTLLSNSEFIFASDHMKKLFASILKFAPTDSTILITGETGSGKEVIAKTIHQNSKRKEGPFISICIPSIPSTLLESEIFGYEKGAFTGSNSMGKPGLVELANHGTLFLDELGDIPIELQVKLLRLLDTLEVTRLGSIESKKLDIRIIAATNKDLYEMVNKKTFREDLLYRLSIIHLPIKPLRERPEDIIALSDHFIDIINKKYGYQKKLTQQSYRVLQSYSWPGNVRELRNVIERICIMSDNNAIMEEEIINVLGNYNKLIQNIPVDDSLKPKSIIDDFHNWEKDKVLDSLIKNNGNKTLAAKSLGISRSKLYRLLEKY